MGTMAMFSEGFREHHRREAARRATPVTPAASSQDSDKPAPATPVSSQGSDKPAPATPVSPRDSSQPAPTTPVMPSYVIQIRPTRNGERVYFTSDTCPEYLRYDLFKMQKAGRGRYTLIRVTDHTKKWSKKTRRQGLNPHVHEDMLRQCGIQYVKQDQQKHIAAKLRKEFDDMTEARRKRREHLAQIKRGQDAQAMLDKQSKESDETHAAQGVRKLEVTRNELANLSGDEFYKLRSEARNEVGYAMSDKQSGESDEAHAAQGKITPPKDDQTELPQLLRQSEVALTEAIENLLALNEAIENFNLADLNNVTRADLTAVRQSKVELYKAIENFNLAADADINNMTRADLTALRQSNVALNEAIKNVNLTLADLNNANRADVNPAMAGDMTEEQRNRRISDLTKLISEKMTFALDMIDT